MDLVNHGLKLHIAFINVLDDKFVGLILKTIQITHEKITKHMVIFFSSDL